MTDPRVAGALRRQLARRQGERVGWKIGLNIPEVQAALGLREPVVGHLTSATRLGSSFDARDTTDLRAEVEIALRAGDGDAVAAFAVALELVDVGRPPPGGLEGIIEENIFHRGFAVGPWMDQAPSGEARLYVGGELRASAPAAVDADGTVEVVARHLAAAGEELRPGDLIIAGAIINQRARPGDEIAVGIDGLGRLELSVV